MLEGLITFNKGQNLDTVRVSYKRTRRGKVRKLVRPVYFREDIPCGVIGCSECAEKETFGQEATIDPNSPILIVDPETAILQTDFIANDLSVNNCILCYTALDAVEQVDRAKSDKLRALSEELGASAKGRSFYSFPNEFVRSTFVPFAGSEELGSLDRDHKSVVAVAKWYCEHLSVPSSRILLLTSTEARRDQARSEGVFCMTVWEYVDSVREQFPLAGEALATAQEINPPAALVLWRRPSRTAGRSLTTRGAPDGPGDMYAGDCG